MYPQILVMFPDLPRYGTVFSEISGDREIVYKNHGRVFELEKGTTNIISERQIDEHEIENVKKYIESSIKNREAKMNDTIKEMRQRQEQFRREVEEGRTWQGSDL